MREIKVRAWDPVVGEYYYSDNFPSMWRFFKHLEDRGIRHFETEQYTGLKDKNGKAIYEGDIVELYKYQGEALYCVTLTTAVKWNNTGLNWNVWTPHNDTVFWKVIGNIYESPHLLDNNSKL